MNNHILAYIDPGTGSMLFAVLLGVITTLFFALRGVIISIKTKLSGGKTINREEKIPLVIFSDGKQYWKVFEPICDELEKRNFRCEYWTASSDDPGLTKDYKNIRCTFIGDGNKPYTTLNVMKAYICLSTTPGLDVYQWKKSKDTDFYVHIYHSVSDGLGYRMFGLDYYDAILSPSKPIYENQRNLERLRNLPPKDIVEGGLTYMDTLKKRYEHEGRKTKNEQVNVLLAPSWGETSILNKYGNEIIDALLCTGYYIIIRPHPQMKISYPKLLEKLQDDYKETKNIEWNFDSDNFCVLNRADVMISDFSGVIFDYAFVFDKPIIYADVIFDSSTYDAAWMDKKYPIDCLPQMGRELKYSEFNNIKEVIDDVLESPQYSDSRKEAKEIMWRCEGKSVDTIVDYIANKYDELVKC